jgi:prefoldin subunit 5
MSPHDVSLSMLTIDQLVAKIEFLQQSIDSLRDELDDVEAEIERRAAA